MNNPLSKEFIIKMASEFDHNNEINNRGKGKR